MSKTEQDISRSSYTDAIRDTCIYLLSQGCMMEIEGLLNHLQSSELLTQSEYNLLWEEFLEEDE